MSTVPSNLIPVRITQLPIDPSPSVTGILAYVRDGVTYQVTADQIVSVTGVPTTRQVIAGTGLTGGGQLLNNVTLSVAPGGIGTTELANSGVTPGTYGSSTEVPVLTIDATGRVMAATTSALSVSGFVPTTRQVIAGTGLNGGGTLASNVTLNANLSNATPQPIDTTGSAGVSTDMSRADHKHPAIDLADDDQVDGLLGLANGGTARSLVPQPGAVVWSGGDGLYIGPAGSVGQVLVSGGTGQYTWGTVQLLTPVGANTIFAGPISGPDVDPSFRAMVNADVPTTLNGKTLQSATITNALSLTAVSGDITTLTSSSATLTNLSSTSGTISTLKSVSADITNLAVSSLTVSSLSLTNATFTSATITTLTSTSAGIATLSGTALGYASGNVTVLTSDSATLNNLTVTSGTVSTLKSTSADITNLSVSSLTVSSLSLTNATFTSATITTLTSTSAGIATLSGTSLGYASGNVTTLTSDSATLTNLTATSGTVSTLKSTSADITNLSVDSLTVSSLSLSNATFTSATITTLKSTSADITNVSAGSLSLTSALGVSSGGTGLSLTASNGQILIGDGNGYALSTLTAGSNVSITNATGSITIAATADVVGPAGATSGAIALFDTGTGKLLKNSVITINSSGVISGVDTPSVGTDAANKQYVDDLVSSGIHVHQPVVLATSPGSSRTDTYNNGTGGVSATLTSASNGTLVIDGTVASATIRVLIQDCSNPIGNGVYVVTDAGSGSSQYVMTRSSDADTAGQQSTQSLDDGSYFFTTGGTTNKGVAWVNTNTGTISFGSTAITFAEFSSSQVYAAGNGLSLTATTFSLETPVSVLNGGTGNSVAPTLGELLIGNGANFSLSTLSAGTGISVSNATGSITLANTAPDQTVTLSGSTAISITGTYPSFTVTNTLPDQTVILTGSTAISIGGTYPSFTVTNTQPDQTVILTGGTGASVTGTYPSFTITSTGTGGTVTSVDASSTVSGFTISGGPITGSGVLTLAGTLSISNGGTGASTQADARTALGLGTIATQDANSVTITGGSIGSSVLVNLSNSTGNISGGTY